ncbi:hypothetical protein BN59_01493 [Legionella massiliensis]|uniref:Uncharacterized protein n=1 Tax=Legionella massiliensis TaxID=1034943 RepID=A0A078KW38_9GAMM|nr:hypothetical protein [Legionella massiliensis]CDZ77211.1 hypothetical protein BN59_01493 [Legionella massiliensis]CEE12949.1 hypothetical protein BN1094_01493 [Legionella massiliensis]
MTTYEKFDLVISGFGAIGTCGATILALYFWYRDEILNLRFQCIHGEGYGSVQNIEGGYLIFKFTNTGYRPISLELAGIKFIRGSFFSKKCSIVEFSMQNNNLVEYKLPILLQHGDSYSYVTPWSSFIELCKNNEFKNINIYAYVSSLSKEAKYKLRRDIVEDLMEGINASNKEP